MIFSPSDITQAFANLRAQKTRTLLTALGIVFGVGSVIGMLSIGAGAKEESLRFIEQLGVRNVLIDSRPTTSQQEFQQRRRSSPAYPNGTFASCEPISRLSNCSPPAVPCIPRVYFPSHPVKSPNSTVYTLVQCDSQSPLAEGSSSPRRITTTAPPSAYWAKGQGQPPGLRFRHRQTCQGERHLVEVVGVLTEQLMAGSSNSGGAMQDVNNIVYIPLNTFQYRFWDSSVP